MDKLNMICAYVHARMLARKDDEGATAVEYGLLVSLIAVVIIVGVKAFGTYLNGLFNGLSAKLT